MSFSLIYHNGAFWNLKLSKYSKYPKNNQVQRSLDILKDKIEDSKHMPLNRLQDEYTYWMMRMSEFEKIERIIKKLVIEEQNLLEQEKNYLELKLV